MKQLTHSYTAPLIELVDLDVEDILTLSNGFDGDEHEFGIE